MAETFTGNPADIHMGPAALFYGDGEDARCLGFTLNDSVKINLSVTPTPITPDQSSLPIKDVITEMGASVDVTLGEVNTENLNILPGVTDGVFKDPIGIDMKAVAKGLKIVPMDESDDKIYFLPKVSPSLNDGISFMKTTPQGLSLNFKAYVDDTEGETKDAYLVVGSKSATANA